MSRTIKNDQKDENLALRQYMHEVGKTCDRKTFLEILAYITVTGV